MGGISRQASFLRNEIVATVGLVLNLNAILTPSPPSLTSLCSFKVKLNIIYFFCLQSWNCTAQSFVLANNVFPPFFLLHRGFQHRETELNYNWNIKYFCFTVRGHSIMSFVALLLLKMGIGCFSHYRKSLVEIPKEQAHFSCNWNGLIINVWKRATEYVEAFSASFKNNFRYIAFSRGRHI